MPRFVPSLFLAGLAFSLSLGAAEPMVVDVKLDSYSFKPDKITVKAGQPVTLKLVNEATFIPHNLVIRSPEAGIEIKLDLSAGKSGEVSFTPTKAGTYEMICDKTPPIGKSHKEKGMHGTLIVEQ
ncbi:MAG: cupredoxin domain-containing protein [Gammaproteobacteria bacterium]|nr:cupredoxin domain-containing protein [Gammaproteobacteria bacterium]